ncbi:MAG: Na+-dependent transporter [archaeon]|nr:Na+-dependent transporter [archaeon]
MDFWSSATDVRVFVVLGIIAAFCIGSIGEAVATISLVVLIAQMTASLHGLHMDRGGLRKDLVPSLWSLVCCFGISAGAALASGLVFMDYYPEMWYGWVMLAAAPPAVSVITVALIMKGDVGMGAVAMAVIYAFALGLTSLYTFVFIGDAVSPLEILKYVVLFIVVPVVLNVPLGRVNIQKKYKVFFINVMMFLLLVLSLGKNRDFIIGNCGIVLVLVVFCILRTFAVSAVMLWYLRSHGHSRERSVVYVAFAVWKNSGLATSMCMILLAGMPAAALPCAVSLVVEAVWFAITNHQMAKYWPAEAEEVVIKA